MSDYDVIIVGGGPAGSTAARRIAQRNLNVLLLDKAKFPRVKTRQSFQESSLVREQ
jgi:halogenation protein CepH